MYKSKHNLEGKQFGDWTVIKFFEHDYNSNTWLCKCICGTTKAVNEQSLIKNMSKSCGCSKQGTPTHGLSKTPEYKSWKAMKRRCYGVKESRYLNYGGRGIKVCSRWLNSFENFIADMGTKPTSKHSLDRIDNDKDYEPSNCRWATPEEQSNNRRPRNTVVHDSLLYQASLQYAQFRSMI